MRVACEVPGDRDRELDLPADATYGDVVRAVGYSVHEASVLVGGTPVPEDAPVEADRVTVLRLVQGGMTRVRVSVSEARPDEHVAVVNVLDGAMLEVDADRVASDAATTLVAREGERVLGALVLDGEEIAAVAVRRSRRGQGIGTALVEAAAVRRERLVAGFDEAVRPFYESLGFEVVPAGEDGRLRGIARPGTGRDR